MSDMDIPEPIDDVVAIEAYKSVLLPILTEADAFLFCASMNLMNAYVKRAHESSEFRKRYKFKLHLARGLEEIIRNRVSGVQIHVSKNVTYVTVRGHQFSFHNVILTRRLWAYMSSSENGVQQWTGRRLQPVALRIFNEARVR